MAANVVSKAKSYAGSQAGAFVDIVTFTGDGDALTIDNRSATIDISLTKTSATGTNAATPTALGDDTYFVPAGSFRVFPGPCKQVKLIGSGNAMAYTVALI